MRWVGLPLLLHAPPNMLWSQLLEHTIGPALSLLRSVGATCATAAKGGGATGGGGGDGEVRWLGSHPDASLQSAASLHSNLVRTIASCELVGALMGRFGKAAQDHFKPLGALSIAAVEHHGAGCGKAARRLAAAE